MAATGISANNLGVGIRQRDRNHAGVQQGHKPANGPGETALALAPAHETAPLQAVNPEGNELGKNLGGWSSLLEAAGKDKRPLGRLAHLKGRGINATAVGETDGSLGGHPPLKGLACRWALAVFAEIALGQG